jgi:small subunit ribosomal protein S20
MRNRSVKSFLKTRIKKFDAAVGAGNLEEAKKQGLLVQKSFDKAVTHGIVHKNRASRIKANVMRKVNRLAGTPAKG